MLLFIAIAALAVAGVPFAFLLGFFDLPEEPPPRPRAAVLHVGAVFVFTLIFANGALAAGSAAAPVGIGFVFDFLRDHLDTILLVATPVVVGAVALLFTRLSRAQQEQLLGATKGAYNVLSAVAPSTPWTWDDAIARLLHQVELEMGRRLKPREKVRVESIAAALLADDKKPDILKGAAKAAALNAVVGRERR